MNDDGWIVRGTLRYRRRGEGTFDFWDEWPNPVGRPAISLRNVKQDDGHVYGDLRGFAGKRRTVVRPKVNLTSDRSLPALGKSLSINAPEGMDYDWGGMLERICAILVDELDQKGVFTALVPLEDKELPQPMFFRNFIPKDLLSGLVAHGGTGKSMTGMLMTLAATTGMQIGPFDPLWPPCNVLYADWENQWKLHARRLTRICKGLGLPFPRDRIFHYEARGKLTHAENELIEFAFENKIGLTITDSIGFAAGGNLNDSDIATSSVQAQKHIPGTKVMIAHISKAAVEGTAAKSPSGNAFFWNGPQAIYDLHASDPDEDGTVTFAIYQNKANVGRKLKRPLGVRITFEDDDNGGPITPVEHDVQGFEAGGEGLPLATRILDFMTWIGKPVSAEDIAERLFGGDIAKDKVDSVKAKLRTLRQDGIVSSEGDGRKGENQRWLLATKAKADDSLPCVRCGEPFVMYGEKGEPLCGNH